MWKHVSDAPPIISVTNGVHVPTWQSPLVRAAADDPGRLWDAHALHRSELLAEIEQRKGLRLDPEGLIIGFARRAAGYKRPDLIVRDEKRLEGLLTRGVHVVLAGKSHPDDKFGKTLIARLVSVERRHPGQVVYLENYDMALGRMLTRGCDVWLNNPIRPLEASGTSGMKAAMNGVLNLSILDGWWPEGCEHGVNGWAIGDDKSGDDERDLAGLYEVLENGVLPAWADRARWVAMMRASITMGVEKFSSDRMLRDYFAELYPAGETRAVEMPGAPAANR
jgi:starch phosphorylase